MKYAFIFGSNIFITTDRIISYSDKESKVQFLKIQSFYAHRQNAEDHVLLIDLDINTTDDQKIVLNNNQPVADTVIEVKVEPKRVQLYRAGHVQPLLDVYQLTSAEYTHLSSHIANEIEAQQPEVVITIKGDFKVNSHHIVIDSERLYVNGDAFGNSVVNAHEGVNLTPDGLPL